jgi:RNA-directed DNA polymerase
MELAVALRNQDIIKTNSIIRRFLRNKDCRILAVYNTISKRGYRSKGYKDKKPRTNVDYSNLIQRLWKVIKNPNGYKATPLKRRYLPKPKGGLRPLLVPSYFDRCIQHLYKIPLDVITEEIQSPYSYGFRPYRSPGWASKSLILATLPRKHVPKYALERDIAKCYDTMDHDWMLANVSNIKVGNNIVEIIPQHILKQWLKCAYISIDDIAKGNENIQPTTRIPQGGPISPTIANIVLNGVEEVILQVAQKHYCTNVNVARFADDITLIFDDIEIHKKILDAVNKFLAPRGMKLNIEKCYLRHMYNKEAFNFVGFTHRMTYRRKPKEIGKKTRTKTSLISLPPANKISKLR